MQPRLSFRAFLFIFILAVSGPLIALLGYSYVMVAQREIEQARDFSTELAQLTAANMRRFLDGSERLLAQLAERPLIRAMDPAACDPAFDTLRDLFPQYTNVVLADRGGGVVCSAVPQPDEADVTFADRQWFRQVMAGGQFTVGDPIVGRITGKWISVLAYPVRDDSGRIVGTLTLPVDLVQYQTFVEDVKLPPATAVVIVDARGVVVAHSLDPETWVGQNARDTEIVDVVLMQEQGVLEAQGIDGLRRLFGFASIAATGWRAYVSMPTDVALGPTYAAAARDAVVGLAIVLLACAVAFVFSRRIERPVSRLAHTAHAIADGDRNTRAPVAGPAEIAQVAVEFNAMLDALQRTENSLRRANRAYQVLSDSNQTVLRAQDEMQLVQEVCQVLADVGGYRLAWVAYAEHDKAGRLRPVAQAGHEAGYLLTLSRIRDEAGLASDPASAAIRTGQTVIVRDLQDDSGGEPWRVEAVQRGYASCVALPLHTGEHILGALNIYAAEAGAFDAVEISLLSELAGDLVYGVTTLRARAELIRTLEALGESEQRLKQQYAASEQLRLYNTNIVDTMAEGLLVVDAAGRVTLANRQLLRMLDYTQEELIGRHGSELLAPGMRAQPVEPSQRRAPGATRVYETALLTRDGREIPVLASDTPFRTDAENTGTLLTFADLTERKQRERELEALVTAAAALRAAPTRGDMLPVIVDQVRSLFQAAGAALVMRDALSGEQVNVLARGAWSEWTGRRSPPGTGITGRVIDTGQPYLNNDALSDPELILIQHHVETRAAACAPLIAQNEVIGAVWIGRDSDVGADELRLLAGIGDIAASALHRAQLLETLERRVAERTSALAEANERLTELDRLKSKFVSDVSHELRTPVTNLRLFLDLLERGRPDRRAQYLETLKSQANRLSQLIEDILDLSRLELGGPSVRFSPVDLNTLIEQVVAAHRPSAQAAGLALAFSPSADLPPVRAERNQLAQVITNLIDNAIRYTHAGEVRITTHLEGGHACLTVRDTGIGIEPEDLAHVFERFYRGRHVTQSDLPGTGLGLAIVKEIVDIHGGEIEVESQVDAGTTFRVSLPVAAGGDKPRAEGST